MSAMVGVGSLLGVLGSGPGEIGLYVVDGGGRILERTGRAPGPGAGEMWESGVGSGSVVRLPLSGGCELVVQGEVECDLAEALAQALARALTSCSQLAGDLDSMSETGATQLETVSMYGDLLRGFGSCLQESDAAAQAALRLAVAGGFARVVFVRTEQELQHFAVGAEVRFDTAVCDHLVVDLPETGLPAAGYRQAVEAALDSPSGTAVILPATSAERASPMAALDAAEAALAVAVRFQAEGVDRTLGVLVCIDRMAGDYRVGRGFGSVECDLADNVAGLLGFHLGSRAVAAYQRELQLAHEIQRQILPQSDPQVPGYDVAGRCETSGDVGGDYYDFLPMADGRTLAVVADVSGHNLASGMVMVGARFSLRLLASLHQEPARIFTGLLEAIFDDLSRTERFITAAGAAITPERGQLELVNAGHNPTMIYRAATDTVENVAGDDPILGFLPGIEYAPCTVELAPGDVVLIYTDGVTEAANEAGEMFEEQRLEATLRRSAARGASASEVLDAVYEAVRAFTHGNSDGDDVTAVVLKRNVAADDEMELQQR